MKTLNRVISRLRAWMGWVDLDENRLSPDHGWLLPTPAVLHTLRIPEHPASSGASSSSTRIRTH